MSKDRVMDESLTLTARTLDAPRAFVAEGATDLGSDLDWLTSVLWPGADVRLAPSRVPAGRRVAEAYAVVPSASRPELLAPFAAPSVATRVMQLRDRRRVAFGRARRSVASHVGRLRFPPLVVFFAREPRADELLTHRLRNVFDRPDVALAISWNGEGRQRIPLVYALTLEGELLGVAKVGWSEPSRRLVLAEAAALRRWERRPARTFDAPVLVHEGMWEGHELTVLSPPPVGSPAPTSPFVSVDEIARSGGIALAQLATTPWWRSLVDGAADDAALTVVLRWMSDLHGRRLMWHGSAHGDWRPHNVSTLDGHLYVSGWERARDGVPLGLDPISFAVERRSRLRGGAPSRWHPALVEITPALRRFGIPHEDEGVLVACYLAERLVRRRQAAGNSRPAGYDSGLEELRRWVGRA
jgi:hypothetical protein